MQASEGQRRKSGRASSADRIDPDLLLAQTAWVQGLARKLVGDSHADDLAQEAMLAALQTPPQADNERRLRAWFSRVLTNAAGMWRRAETSRQSREEFVARVERTDTEESLVERAGQIRLVVAELLNLEEPYRTTLLMTYFEGADAKQISSRLGISYVAARKRISRGLEQLRARLESRGERGEWMNSLLPLLLASEQSFRSAPLGWTSGSWATKAAASARAAQVATFSNFSTALVAAAATAFLLSLVVVTEAAPNLFAQEDVGHPMGSDSGGGRTLVPTAGGPWLTLGVDVPVGSALLIVRGSQGLDGLRGFETQVYVDTPSEDLASGTSETQAARPMVGLPINVPLQPEDVQIVQVPAGLPLDVRVASKGLQGAQMNLSPLAPGEKRSLDFNLSPTDHQDLQLALAQGSELTNGSEESSENVAQADRAGALRALHVLLRSSASDLKWVVFTVIGVGSNSRKPSEESGAGVFFAKADDIGQPGGEEDDPFDPFAGAPERTEEGGNFSNGTPTPYGSLAMTSAFDSPRDSEVPTVWYQLEFIAQQDSTESFGPAGGSLDLSDPGNRDSGSPTGSFSSGENGSPLVAFFAVPPNRAPYIGRRNTEGGLDSVALDLDKMDSASWSPSAGFQSMGVGTSTSFGHSPGGSGGSSSSSAGQAAGIIELATGLEAASLGYYRLTRLR